MLCVLSIYALPNLRASLRPAPSVLTGTLSGKWFNPDTYQGRAFAFVLPIAFLSSLLATVRFVEVRERS